ncbi:MAG: hypothetical protein JHD09_02835 [Gemmataceae bacterium]|jgi:hypothetical protein|nr:hypothetical protein [Gemmataceae bacterium]MCY2971204.1 hypothetical protein [Planctomycetota bacterium]NBS88898.1 hypothetical protein [bacterium]NBT61801.1 hypothetical protein [Planctomycetia bacterium]MBJ7344198.1 hypothetical protein [Gemmataceae bacterium]
MDPIVTPIIAAGYYWHLPILILVISLVYSATRHDDWKIISIEAYRWGVRMLSFLGMIGLFLYIITLLP